MVNQLLQVVALFHVKLDILLFHVVTNIVVEIAKRFSNWDVHLFYSSN